MAGIGGGGGSGPTVARAYVAIIPTTKGAQKEISKSLIPEMEAAGKDGGEHLSGGIGDSLKSGSAKIASIAKAALAGAGIAAVTKFVHDAYDAFSSFEQLEGGVKTIFGDAAADTVIANARRAFSTVQMSANAYLDTVTSFSASLIQSLGGDTEAAARMADMAVSDMADNANKMGTDIASIQVAYQGFAKQNYSMLDNLKLGYGGTQQEMYRLLQDAANLNAEFAQTANFSIDDKGHLSAGFADITRAIHIVQESMGIAGASAQEAATTLEGSFNMMSASWQNLLVAFGEGTPDAIKPAVDNLILSVGTWLSNAIPRIGIIISGIVSYIPTLARDIIAALPGMVSDIAGAFVEQVGAIDLGAMLQPVIDAAMENSLFAPIVSFAGRIGEAFRAVFGEGDIATTFESIRGAVETAMGAIMDVIQAVQMTFASLVNSIDTATIVSVMEGLKQAGDALIGVLTTIGITVAQVLVNLVLPTIKSVWGFVVAYILPGVMALWKVIQPGVMMLIDMLGQVYGWIAQLVSSIAGLAGRIGEAFSEVFGDIDIASTVDAIQVAITTALGVIQNAFQTVQQVVISVIESIDTATIISVMEVLRQAGEALIGALMTLGGIVADVFVGLVLPTLHGIWDFVAGIILPGIISLWETIQPGIEMVIGMLGQVYDWISQLIYSLIDFLVPAIALILEIAAPVIQGLMEGIGEILGTLISSIQSMWNTIAPFVSRVVADLSAFFSELGKWIRAVWPVVSWVANQIGQVLAIVVRTVTSMVSGLISGIGNIIKGIIGVVTGIASVIYDLITGNFDALQSDFMGLINSIGSIVWGVIEVITSPFRYAFGQLRDLWNSTIGSLSFTVPDWVPGIGGAGFSMPKLASGGTIMQAGTVMVGEAGPEILTLPRGARVAPLSDADASAGTTYNVVVGDVNLSDDDEVRRITRSYLERLARLAQPGGVVMA